MPFSSNTGNIVVNMLQPVLTLLINSKSGGIQPNSVTAT
jgi:hypothetical protein